MQRHLKVLTSFSFLRLRGRDVFWYQWVYPTVFAVILFLFRYVGMANAWFSGDDGFFDERQIISDLMSLLGMLVGFYIAALAAVASFKSEILDGQLKGLPTTLNYRRGGKKEKEELNRRRFISVVFGYCASMSIVLYVFGMGLLYVSMGDLIVRNIVVAVFYWGLSSLFIVTLLGLHYLVDRMHRE